MQRVSHFKPCVSKKPNKARIRSSPIKNLGLFKVTFPFSEHNLNQKHNQSAMSHPRRNPKFPSEYVPDHIVHNILPCLPAKSLIRFRSVSKSLNSTITTPIFITTHFNLNKTKSLSNSYINNGYLLSTPLPMCFPSSKTLFTNVLNSDNTMTMISMTKVPFNHSRIIGFLYGMFCLVSYESNCKHIIHLWNPSIRKFKKLVATSFTSICDHIPAAFGLAYLSQNNDNDYKILRIGCCQLAEAEVYTLSKDSWRRVVISPMSIRGIDDSPGIFFNGALHFITYYNQIRNFILSFDVNDEIFQEIMMPDDYIDEVFRHVGGFSRYLVVFEGSLALIAFSKGNRCRIWAMREYGVFESWTKKVVSLDWVDSFYGCTDNCELLIEDRDGFVSSFDPESLKTNSLGIQFPSWVGYTTNLLESLVLME